MIATVSGWPYAVAMLTAVALIGAGLAVLEWLERRS